MTDLPRLVLVDIPKDCEDSRPLLNLESKPFNKTIKRVMKKLAKGYTNILSPLPLLSETGENIPSPYRLVADNGEPPAGLLFAGFNNGHGSAELNQLPLTLVPSTAPTPQSVEDSLQQFAQRLDNIDTSLSVLTSPVSASFKKPVPARKPSDRSLIASTPSTPKAATATRKRVVSTPQPINPHFMDQLDSTISRVLKRMDKGKNIESLNNLESTIYLNSTELGVDDASIPKPEVGSSLAHQTAMDIDPSGIVEKKKKKRKSIPKAVPVDYLMHMDMGDSSVDLDAIM